jgi:ribose 5-phosphate isomerase B
MAVIDERGKQVITERELRDAARGDTIRIGLSALITPLAADLARERGVIVERTAPRYGSRRQRIALAADHGGFEMKEEIKRVLSDLGHEYQDFGASSTSPVDYPDYAHVAARAVASGACTLGIIVDGAGIGSCMVANKVPGIRAAMCYDEATARNSREHNGANVLTLGGKMISFESMRKIVETWLSADLTEERHKKRVAKIESIERNYSPNQ